MIGSLKQRWAAPGGYKEVLRVALPLILSTGSNTLQQFIDRIFLTWYSPETIAAAMPAGIFNFMFLSFFIGTTGYVSTFVAQYYGAKRLERIGATIWQGLYFALLGGIFILTLIPFSTSIFTFFGHDSKVVVHESQFFSTLCLGAPFVLTSSVLSCFYSGLGKTWPVMWVYVGGTIFNIVFDYLLIFGKAGFPELGITGAGLATSLSALLSLILFIILIFNKKNNQKYHILHGFRFDGSLFRRLLRYGVPSGVQFFLDIAGFTAFVLLVGRLGMIPLAATNIAFSINMFAFMPITGAGIAVSILVGQAIGEKKPELAQKSVYSAFQMSFLYMAIFALVFIVFPDLFLFPYAAKTDPAEFSQLRAITTILLRFVAFYSLFDSLNLIFSAGIKGAGDTTYVMFSNIILSFGVLILPVFLGITLFKIDIYTCWIFASAYICLLGFNFFLRFLTGKWKAMRVIEEEAVPEEV